MHYILMRVANRSMIILLEVTSPTRKIHARLDLVRSAGEVQRCGPRALGLGIKPHADRATALRCQRTTTGGWPQQEVTRIRTAESEALNVAGRAPVVSGSHSTLIVQLLCAASVPPMQVVAGVSW
jgi:hypothetical protein